MSLDKTEKKPLGLKITNFITTNIIWYLVFALIYWNLNPSEWWLLTSIWGRLILIILEYGIIASQFKDNNSGKN